MGMYRWREKGSGTFRRISYVYIHMYIMQRGERGPGNEASNTYNSSYWNQSVF